MIPTKNDGIVVATNPIINRFAEQQETCLAKLLDTIENPFPSIWHYLKWKREAVMLQLSQSSSRTLHLDSRALYGMLIQKPNDEDKEPETNPDRARRRRNLVVQIMHNDLVVSFANARMELARRETEQDEHDKL